LYELIFSQSYFFFTLEHNFNYVIEINYVPVLLPYPFLILEYQFEVGSTRNRYLPLVLILAIVVLCLPSN
jgi:hypothetical protein